jgi:hypothetical protein
MAEVTFSDVWESADSELHKTIHILKGAIGVGAYTEHDEETVLGLVYVALEKVENARHQLEQLHKCHSAPEKTPKEPATPPPRQQSSFSPTLLYSRMEVLALSFQKMLDQLIKLPEDVCRELLTDSATLGAEITVALIEQIAGDERTAEVLLTFLGKKYVATVHRLEH